MTGKNLINYHFLKEKNFVATEIWEILQMLIKYMQEDSKIKNIFMNTMICILKVYVTFGQCFQKFKKNVFKTLSLVMENGPT